MSGFTHFLYRIRPPSAAVHGRRYRYRSRLCRDAHVGEGWRHLVAGHEPHSDGQDARGAGEREEGSGADSRGSARNDKLPRAATRHTRASIGDEEEEGDSEGMRGGGVPRAWVSVVIPFTKFRTPVYHPSMSVGAQAGVPTDRKNDYLQ